MTDATESVAFRLCTDESNSILCIQEQVDPINVRNSDIDGGTPVLGKHIDISNMQEGNIMVEHRRGDSNEGDLDNEEELDSGIRRKLIAKTFLPRFSSLYCCSILPARRP